MNKSLKNIFIFFVTSALIFAMSISIISVYIIINKQNQDASNDLLEKTLNVVIDDLSGNELNLLSQSDQTLKMDSLDLKIGSLIEYRDDLYWMLRNQYFDITKALYLSGLSSGADQLALYDNNNNLLAFFNIKNDDVYTGFVHNESTVETLNLKKDDPFSLQLLIKNDSMEEVLPRVYEGNEILKETVKFENHNGFLSQVSYKPVVYEEKAIGFLMIAKRIPESYIKNVSKLLGTNINIFLNNDFSMGDHSDYEHLDSNLLPNKIQSWNIKEQNLLFNDITINNNQFFQCVLPIYTDSVYIGAVSAFYSKDNVKKNTWEILNILIILSVICIIISIPLTVIFSNSLTKPIRNIVHGLKDVAEGDGNLTKRLEISSIKEIGELSGWFNIFIEKLQHIIQGIKVNTDKLGSSSIKLSDISTDINENSSQSATKSDTVVNASKEMSSNMESVASAMEKTSANVSFVVTSATELTKNINEIVHNSENSRHMTEKAVLQTEKTTSRVEELGKAALEINNVTEAITEISEQTNLLALNATIEAARAGDSGKGFAVVANEIKNLAKQTSDATVKIKNQIEGIQVSAADTVKDIKEIRSITNDVNNTVSSIATSVGTQSKTTEEIASNVSQASLGIEEINQMIINNNKVSSEINQDISDVNISNTNMSDNCSLISTNSQELKEMVLALQNMISSFKV